MDLLAVLVSLVAVLVSLLGIVVSLVILTLVKSMVMDVEDVKEEIVPDKIDSVSPHTNGVSRDQYTPEYAEGTVPLEQFTPNFSKPVSYTIKDDEEGHGLEETPQKDDK